MTILKASGLTKVYGSSRRAETRALDGFSFEVEKGRFVGIMGPSGSGKTTLLNVLATIDAPTSGTVWVDGLDTSQLKGEELALFRRKRLGFVFQDYNLLDSLSIEENIALPLAGPQAVISHQKACRGCRRLAWHREAVAQVPLRGVRRPAAEGRDRTRDRSRACTGVC